MTAAQAFIGVFIVVLACLESGCRHGDCSGRWVSSVFANFVYVGEFPDDRRVAIPVHGQDRQPLPVSFQKGRAYVFHSNGPVSTETVALHDFPDRLNAAGVQILSRPTSAGEFGIPNSGGPIWQIRFGYDGCAGEIYDTVDQTLYKNRLSWADGSRQDYVLVFSK